MASLQKYQNKKIAIYGMGISGYSAAKKLQGAKAKLFCWDDNYKIRKKIKKLNLPISKFWKKNNTIDYIIISPGIDVNKCKIQFYLKNNYKKIITDLDIFFELNKGEKIISITGTNGKSTTCKIIEKIFKVAGYNAKTGGNIGNSVLSLKKSKTKNIFILEVSSYQLQYSKLFRSKHSAILNISPDHLDRHKNIKNYINTKSKIFLAQKKSDFSYINFKNKYSKSINKIFKNKKIKSKLIQINRDQYNFLLNKVKNDYFSSIGNIENLLFAYEIAKKFKISNTTIINALNKFKGLPHRQEVVLSNKKVVCVNDSKATSFEACLQSLLIYDKIYWILGGLPKKNDLFNLKNISKKIIKAYVIGKNTKFFVKQIQKKISYKISGNLKNAIKNIYNDIKKRKNLRSVILLSPAAASFDQFNNFESRGNYFKNLAIKKFKNN
tara:strand:- start:398 stop:1711 length:1314 start_codon:yes stop_codon:yes gene_type:complete